MEDDRRREMGMPEQPAPPAIPRAQSGIQKQTSMSAGQIQRSMSLALAQEIEEDPEFVDKTQIDSDLFRFAMAAETSWRRRKAEAMDYVQCNFDRYPNKYHNVILSPLQIPPE